MSECSAERRCRRRECSHCGPIRSRDEFHNFRANIDAYGGRVIVVAVSAPGADVLPWDESICSERGRHKHRGDQGCRIQVEAAVTFNVTATRRYARLWKAATLSADRVLRRHGYSGRMPTRIANVWSPQGRGVWHVHEALPAGSPLELLWSRQVVNFIDHARRSESRMSGDERYALLEIERHFGVKTRGFYGVGYVDRNPLRATASAEAWESTAAAAYLARNVSEYLSKNVGERSTLPGRWLRQYVSRRLTKVTGVTLGNLRRKRYLYVCIRDGLPLPESWSPELIETIWRLLAGSGLPLVE